MNILPNDSKSKRKSLFMELTTPDSKTGYIDGATDYCMLKPFGEDLSREDKLWLVFLYSLSYSCTTPIRMFAEFPSINDVKSHSFNTFWKENKPTLWFNPDRRYLKNMNQVGSAIRSVKRKSKDFCGYIEELLSKGFDKAYKEITSDWAFFGPMAVYLFFDAVYGLLPELYTDPMNLDWKRGTVVEGMAHLLYQDEVIQTKAYDFNKYNKIVNKLVSKTNQPKVIIESCLCAFRKLFKSTRYVGYYADRQLCECIETYDIIDKKYGLDIWNYREHSVQDNLRGEIHGWSGIRKERLGEFVQTGELL